MGRINKFYAKERLMTKNFKFKDDKNELFIKKLKQIYLKKILKLLILKKLVQIIFLNLYIKLKLKVKFQI